MDSKSLLKKYKLKKGFKPGSLIEKSRVKMIISKKKTKDGTLGKTDFINNKPVKITIYKGNHGKNKKDTNNRIIDTMKHEETHAKHPEMTEKEVYKATNVKNMKKMSKKAKDKLRSKFKTKKRTSPKAGRKKAFLKDEKEGIKEYKQAIKKSKGNEKGIYKKILPDERKHLGMIKRIK